jgi:D-alanyl-D-alanine carboxypeptidase
MVRIHNLLILFIFIFFAAVADPSCAFAKSSKKKASSGVNNKYSSIVIDAETGAILSQSNPDKPLHPASLTKLMTLLLTFDALEKGTLKPNDRIPVSHRAASMMPSKLGLQPGETIRVQDAVNAVVTKSANDMAVTLAEAVGGSERNFASMMNSRAQGIGMTRTRFTNASGLHDPKQVSTARDMAKMARYIIKSRPKYYPLFKQKSFVYAGRTYRNHNRLMETYAGMDGMKTGYVNASGFNLVASAVRNNQRIIGVVFGGQSAQSRNTHMASLLDQGFAGMNNIAPEAAAASLSEEKVSPETQMGMVTLSANALSLRDQQVATSSAAPHSLGTVRVASLTMANDSGSGAVSDASPLAAQQVALTTPQSASGWAVQVGAFQSRVATDRAIYQALHKLPPALGGRATPMIVPLRTANADWVFRARISGFTQVEAQQACAYLGNCLVISPQAY